MGKEGSANIKFIVLVLFFSLLMAFFAFSVGITLNSPGNLTINITTSRNINFTFTPIWRESGENASNCSLWTNFTGTWQSIIDFNGSKEGVYSESTNITNASVSWVNYTFTHDIGFMFWDIACRNGTPGDVGWFFNASKNRTLAIDTIAPNVSFSADTSFNGWNTSSANPTLTFNIKDLNNISSEGGTGINLTTNGNNATLNVTILNVDGGNGGDSSLISYNISNSSLSCTGGGGAAVTSTTCTLTLNTFSLTNGTKNITVSVSDRAGLVNTTSFYITVDQIPPYVDNKNISIKRGSAGTAGVWINDTPPNTGAQGVTFYVVSNWSDNLTQPFEIKLQILNSSTGVWFDVNTTLNITGDPGQKWGNISYTPPQGHNIFEGRNISIRVNGTDIMNNSNVSRTLLLMINDTTAPSGLSVALSISSELKTANGTNTTDTTPTIVWNITQESNELNYVAIQVDSSTSKTCNLFQNYTATVDGLGVVNDKTNDTMTVLDTGGCAGLGNGTHTLKLTTGDSWGNSQEYLFSFAVQTGEAMNIVLGPINTSKGGSAVGAVNQTNITPYHLLSFNATLDGGVVTLKNMTWTSSCNSSINVYINATAVAPFNYSGCKGVEANFSINVTLNDHVGNSLTRYFQFGIDDIAPLIGVDAPSNGFSTTGIIDVNVSAFDKMSRVNTIGYYLDGGFALFNHSMNESTLTSTNNLNTSRIRSINFTAGTHTIKISVNDTLGNRRNSSVHTFVYNGPFNFYTVNASLMAHYTNYSNVSVFDSNRVLVSDSSIPRNVNETWELFFTLNNTHGHINVSIDFNGSAANWDALNFTIGYNETKYRPGIENNFTARIMELITFNTSSDGFTDSIDEFISDSNSYYGFVDLTLNATNVSGSSSALGGIFELWYFEDETALNSKVNISECKNVIGTSAGYTHRTATPCWNNTLNKTVRVYVPHFSSIALINDSRAPNISINYPKDRQTESVFTVNITVSNDAVLCNVSYIGASSKIGNKTMTGPTSFEGKKICTYTLDNVTNGTAQNNNITFLVWDSNDNLNKTEFNFNVSDTTTHNLTSLANGTTGSTTWTITVTANESVNVTLHRGTAASLSVTTNTSEIDFAKTQSISLSSLSASTQYWFNVTTCDKAGNCIVNGTHTFTTSAAAAAEAAAAAAAAAGGGGGGAVPTTTVAASQAQVWQTVPAGTSFSLKVDKAAIAITSVAVSEVKSELKNVEIEAAALTENPVSTEAAAKVYQYLRINKKNLADTDAGSLKVGFRVTKAWLTENSLASGDIALYRYKDDKWNELATKVTGTDATYVNYEAQTPGFSSFAVGTKSGVVVEEAPAVEAPAEEVPEEEAAPPEAVEAPKAVEAPSKAPTAWIIAAVVVILGIILIVAYQKKKQQV